MLATAGRASATAAHAERAREQPRARSRRRSATACRTAPTWRPCRHDGDVLGRRRPGADDPGAGLGNAAIAAVGTPEQKERFGTVYASMAITEPGVRLRLGRDPRHRAPRRRRLGAQRREDLRHRRRSLRRGRGVGDARQEHRHGRDQVVRGDEGHARHAGREARAQARHPRVGHGDDPVQRLPHPEGQHARRRRDRRGEQGVRAA